MSAGAEPLPASEPRPARRRGEPWVIVPRGPGLAARIEELHRYRHLLRRMALQAVRRTYRKTALGWTWLVLRPLIAVIAAAWVFGKLLGAPSGGVPYFLFYLVGSAEWQLFSTAVMWVTRSFERNKGLLRRMYFPRIYAPVSALAPALVEFGIHCGLIAGALAYFRLEHDHSYLASPGQLPWALVAILLTTAAAATVGLWLGVLATRWRDVILGLRYGMRLVYFLTPVLYPLSAVPAKWRPWVSLNPLAALAESFRFGILGVGAVSARNLLPALLLIGVLGLSGIVYFWRADASMADRI